MYNDLIIENFTNPKNTGTLQDFDLIVNTGNPVCDDRLSIWVKIKDDTIERTSQKAYGCATSLATASIFSEFIKGQDFDSLEKTNPNALAKELLGELEPSQAHCYEIFEELFDNLMKKISDHVL